MDPDPPRSSSPRKVKFAPKGPTTRRRRPVPKRVIESDIEDDEENNEALLRKLDDNLKKRRPRAGKKSSVHVTFAGGVASGSDAKEGSSGIKSGGKVSKDSSANTCRDVISLATESSQNAASSSLSKTKKKEYKEPWDYQNSYYPITLPLRRPGSGDPEVLDFAEFGENAELPDDYESTINSASCLGLMEEDMNAKMMMFQLPTDLPFGHRRPRASLKQAPALFKLPGQPPNGSDTKPSGKTASSKGKGKETASVDTNQFPPAHMGKMLVYKSGKVKMKIGDVLYDVSPGVDHAFAQDVAVMNTKNRKCCVLGEMGEAAVVIPEFDSICIEPNRLSKP